MADPLTDLSTSGVSIWLDDQIAAQLRRPAEDSRKESKP
jgi:hypothetical protein